MTLKTKIDLDKGAPLPYESQVRKLNISKEENY